MMRMIPNSEDFAKLYGESYPADHANRCLEH